mmetsp:Transcript_6783/g.18440  ORF Transcript_6783/g.18440 Transcript_6783/m.18440 type:complete len:246 (-) Transcript_6783:396-1133(-)
MLRWHPHLGVDIRGEVEECLGFVDLVLFLVHVGERLRRDSHRGMALGEYGHANGQHLLVASRGQRVIALPQRDARVLVEALHSIHMPRSQFPHADRHGRLDLFLGLVRSVRSQVGLRHGIQGLGGAQRGSALHRAPYAVGRVEGTMRLLEGLVAQVRASLVEGCLCCLSMDHAVRYRPRCKNLSVEGLLQFSLSSLFMFLLLMQLLEVMLKVMLMRILVVHVVVTRLFGCNLEQAGLLLVHRCMC